MYVCMYTGAEAHILPKNFFYVGINNETENVRYSKILRLKITKLYTIHVSSSHSLVE